VKIGRACLQPTGQSWARPKPTKHRPGQAGLIFPEWQWARPGPYEYGLKKVGPCRPLLQGSGLGLGLDLKVPSASAFSSPLLFTAHMCNDIRLTADPLVKT